MAAQDLALKVLLQVDASQSSKISGFGSILGELKNPANLLKGGLLAAGAAVIGFGAASVQMAAEYDKSMRMVQSLTGASDSQMKQYDAGLKALAIDSGVGPTKLSQGLYFVISAGYSGAAALQALSLATKDAVIGLTDSKVTANALVTVMQGFNEKTSDMVKVNGEMLRTVTLGKMTMQDYSGAISKVAVLHAQFHVTLEDTNATLATLTSSGYKSATVAATAYGQLVGIMDGKTDLMTKRIHKLGLGFDETKFKQMDYQHQLAYLNTVMQGHYDQLQNVLGGSKQAASAFTTLETHSKMFSDNLKALSNQQQNATATQSAWAITQGGFSQTMARAGAAVQVLMINVGQALLPVLTKLGQQLIPLITGFTTWIMKSGILQTVAGLLAGAFTLVFNIIGKVIGAGAAIISFFANNQVAAALLIGVLVGIGTAIAMAVVPGFVAAAIASATTFSIWVAGALAAAAATIAATWPILLIGAIVAAVVTGIILAIQHWGAIVTWLKGIWQDILNFFQGLGSFFKGLWDGVVKLFQAASDKIGGIFKILGVILLLPFAPILIPIGLVILAITHLGQIGNWLIGKWKLVQSFFAGLGSFISGVFSGIGEGIKGAINFLIGLIDLVIGSVNKISINTPLGHIGFSIPMIPKLSAGIENFKGGLAYVHAGEVLTTLPRGANVIPANRVSGAIRASGGGGGSGGYTHNGDINIYAPNADANEVARKVEAMLDRKFRRSGSIVTTTSGGRAAS